MVAFRVGLTVYINLPKPGFLQGPIEFAIALHSMRTLQQKSRVVAKRFRVWSRVFWIV